MCGFVLNVPLTKQSTEVMTPLLLLACVCWVGAFWRHVLWSEPERDSFLFSITRLALRLFYMAERAVPGLSLMNP